MKRGLLLLSGGVVLMGTGLVMADQPSITGRPTFTGNATVDFKDNQLTFNPGATDPGRNYLKTVVDNLEDGGGPDIQFTNGMTTVTSGYDIKQLHAFYDPLSDNLFLAIETYNIAGDADANGDPGASSISGVSDYKDFGYYESVDVFFDMDEDLLPDFVFGKASIAPPTVSSLKSNFRAATWIDYQQPYDFKTEAVPQPNSIPDVNDLQQLTPTQSSTKPHIEFLVRNFSQLVNQVRSERGQPPFDRLGEALVFGMGAYMGSSDNVGKVGEDDVPAEDEDFLTVPSLTVGPFPPPLGSIRGRVDLDWPTGFDDRDAPVANPVIRITGPFTVSGNSSVQFTGAADGSYDTRAHLSQYGGKLRPGNYTVEVVHQTSDIYKPASSKSITVRVQEDVSDVNFVLVPEDDDGDYIFDQIEIEANTAYGDTDGDRDNDGTPDYLDTDSDNDGYSDQFEAGIKDDDGDGNPDYEVSLYDADSDFDGDGIPNELDADSDNDGYLDLLEGGQEDTDGDGTIDLYDIDSDNDLILDGVEAGVSQLAASPDTGPLVPGGAPYTGDQDPTTTTDPDDPDTDDDCLSDGMEDSDLDSSDGEPGEQDGAWDPLTETDPNSSDTDGDGVADYTEAGFTSVTFDGNVCEPDQSPNDVTDPHDADTDDDGIPDGDEDADHDGQVDEGETDPNNPDTDGDGIQDGTEEGVTTPTEDTDTDIFVPDDDPSTTTDPLDADTDDDGIPDGEEDEDHNGNVDEGETDPNNPDTDGDGLQDGTEEGVDVPTTPDTDTDVFQPDEDPSTTTDPLDADTDDDGIVDGDEDSSHDGTVDPNETDPNEVDTDGDGIQDGTEEGVSNPPSQDTDIDVFVPDEDPNTTTNPLDADTDDDGIPDGTTNGHNGEDVNNDGAVDISETDPSNPDTDGDGLQDGTEIGLTVTDVDPDYTDMDTFEPDTDPNTTTDPLDDDTDDDGIVDGHEDSNHNGAYDTATETDPKNVNTDGDCEQDGTELGLTSPEGTGTDLSVFEPDETPDTTFDPKALDVVKCFSGIATGGGGFGSCSMAPIAPNGKSPAGYGWAVLLVGVAGLMRRRRSLRSASTANCASAVKTVAGLVVVGATSVAGSAQADVVIPTEPAAVETQQFHPAEDVSGTIMTSGSTTIPKGRMHFGGWLNYAKEPLIFQYEDGTYDVLQDNVVGLEVTGAYGVSDRLQLGLSLPLTVYQTMDLDSRYVFEASPTALNDINVRLRYQLVPKPFNGFGLAIEPRLSLPTGNPDSMTGGGALAGAQLIADYSMRGKWFGANVGYRHRFVPATLGNLSVGPEVVYRLGMGMPINNIFWSLDLFGSLGFMDQNQDTIPEAALADKPLEAMLGASKSFDRFTATFGLSAGLVAGYGTPDFRLVASLAWGEVRPFDRDGDGIIDSKDQCPDQPEDFDNFEDEDGCPDPDNDKDTILDVKDACPNVPENFNGFEDTDGCPEVDTDKDGLYDSQDKCPLEPEDKDGFEDTDGCPDPDNDKDNILDVNDKCPNDPETYNGIDDQDGCPEKDRDGDGIMDSADQCPDVPEDKDGDQDWDGCPEETLDDYVKLEPIYFYVDSDKIRPVSFPTLNKVAGVLNKMKGICVAIQGHTSLEGSDEYNLNLSNKRSVAIQNYLVGQGIDFKRIDAEGFGEKYPAVDEVAAEAQGKAQLEEARNNNRRIEFVIIDCDTRKPKGSGK